MSPYLVISKFTLCAPTSRPARVALLALLVAACGDNTASSATTDETTTTTAPTTETPDPTTTTTLGPTTDLPTTTDPVDPSTTTDPSTTDTIDPVCQPGAIEACYSGPDGTLDVGVCKAGERTCLDDGTGFGPCVGEVTPAPEDCRTFEDENCLGDDPECGPVEWAKRFGGLLLDEVSDLAVGPDGSIAITGRFHNVIDFGGGPLASAGAYDGYLARFDYDGDHQWSRHFGSPADEWGRSVDIDALGRVLLTATITGTADFGGDNPYTSAGAQDIVVAAYLADGQHGWSTIYHGPDFQLSTGGVFTSLGDVILGGIFVASFNLGPATLTSAGSLDIFLARLDSSGAHQWSSRFGDAQAQAIEPLVVLDSQDNILQAGLFLGELDFGGGPLIAPDSTYNLFVAKLDDDGNHLWSRSFGGAFQQVHTLAVDPGDRVIFGGYFFDGALDLGGGPFVWAGEGYDSFIAVYDPDGAHVWSRHINGLGSVVVEAVAADAAGNIFVGGSFIGTLDLGGGPLTANPDGTAFLAKFSPAGEHLASVAFNGAGKQYLHDLAVDPAGHPVVVGTFNGTIEIAGELLTSAGDNDIFLAKLAL